MGSKCTINSSDSIGVQYTCGLKKIIKGVAGLSALVFEHAVCVPPDFDYDFTNFTQLTQLLIENCTDILDQVNFLFFLLQNYICQHQTGPAGRVWCWQIHCREHKTGQQKDKPYSGFDPLCPSRYIIYL